MKKWDVNNTVGTHGYINEHAQIVGKKKKEKKTYFFLTIVLFFYEQGSKEARLAKQNTILPGDKCCYSVTTLRISEEVKGELKLLSYATYLNQISKKHHGASAIYELEGLLAMINGEHLIPFPFLPPLKHLKQMRVSFCKGIAQ